MRLGIDFGTTRIVAAVADRGNFPVVAFECPDGSAREWVPPVVAVRGDERLYGWAAWAAQGETGVTLVRSVKRVLSEAGPDTLIALGHQRVPMCVLLSEMLSNFRSHLLERSSLTRRRSESMEVMLGVPANANSNQRFLTVEGFRSAGFEVLGLLNEPSAASLEYAHRLGDGGDAAERILVYDLGGGTFDVSLVEQSESTHRVVATESIPTLGGDDFDEVLATLALRAAGHADDREALDAGEEFLLAEECRARKEALHPNTRRLVIDLECVREGWGQATVPVTEFYEECRPLIEETLHATDDVLIRMPEAEPVSLYVTGGGSELPLVSRLLRERFGRRVKRSAYTRAATAIGLAIQAGGQSAYTLSERFTRNFGVWREGDAGRRMIFDPLFERDTALPSAGAGAVERVRRYHPVHNVGHFRYLECSHRGAENEPTGTITTWDEIRFPFDPALRHVDDLGETLVGHLPGAESQEIEERYSVDAGGVVTVQISNLTSGYSRTYRLGRWAAQPQTVAPHKTPRRRKKASP